MITPCRRSGRMRSSEKLVRADCLRTRTTTVNSYGHRDRLFIEATASLRERKAGVRVTPWKGGTPMNDRTHFSYRIDRWDDAGEYPVEHLAGVEDSEVAEATYWAAH